LEAGPQGAGFAAAACVALLFGTAAWTQPHPTEGLHCAGTHVSVHGISGVEAETACQGAADAVTFLASFGLDTSAPVEIHVVDRLPHVPAGRKAFGCHAKSERRIYMLTFADCAALGLASAFPVDLVVYRSLVAHEVAHHGASANFRVEKPTRVAHEYIAYVTMFSTMPADAREKVLGLYPGKGFLSEREIGLTVYMIDPQRFGANAYRHFTQPRGGAPFLERILSGRALAVEDPE
ncbi:MAG TPA: DUF6639 family protein, partial [Burkholderiaceae bacterium]|nr:DUF6639 family protein [Burkholderiaceae bacterium]